ncbi:hypothetical protein FUT88_13505 [Ralstonia sp. TCR112]|uniref:replicative helicase loader/inhibitor n=1 Tax=Ralstonia sp. TCR112 TaxID=2601730 RepID=UPI0011BF6C06|nr:replicative helicase loader/inhibitor [Ralstonia sp. TCR112]TXD58885.1 hypothetical protein FUT88_13505 [Ralstonia sp. TCR112]
MHEQDRKEFAEVIRATFDNYHREQPMNSTLRVWWEMLAGFDMAAVRGACMRYIATEPKYPPTIGQLLGLLRGSNGGDGRLGADEAWARALTGMDESETIITTPEIMAAFSIAQTVLESGDEVGARMAFKDVYNRIVSEARAAGKPVEWQASLGWDAEKRARVVNQAVAAGFLPAPKAAALLPPPKPKTQDVYPEGLARVKAMMATLTSKREQFQRAREAESAADRDRTAAAKQQAEEMTREHEKKSASDFAKNPTHAASF